MRFLLMFVGGQEFHKLKPNNCKGFKNANPVISSKNWSPETETFFLEAVDFTGVDVLEEYT